jgi:hypothetical protein
MCGLKHLKQKYIEMTTADHSNGIERKHNRPNEKSAVE